MVSSPSPSPPFPTAVVSAPPPFACLLCLYCRA
uniref:Uncharacterized protein n=1 Tax=Arundo donax TaxID=35708 RepID=A0A0A9E7R0_ARUDO